MIRSFAAVAAAGAVAACLAVALPSIAQDAALGQLDRLAGTWSGTGTFVDSAHSRAGTATATTACAWSADRLFMICQQSVTLDGKPDHDVAIYTYDAAAGKYHFYNIGIARANGTGLAVNGNAIAYTDSFEDKGKTVATRTLNIWADAQTYRWRSEYSTDGGAHWTLMGSGTSTRIR